MLTKKEADKIIKKMKGEARGLALKVDWKFVNERYGKKGIKKLEDKMKELGYPVEYTKINQMDFYPLGLYVVSLLSIRDVFNLDDEQIVEMGKAIVKFNIFTKIFVKYFGSLKLIAEETPKNWKRHYTVGALEMPEFSEKKRYAILKIKDFKSHPVHCLLLKGFFIVTARLAVKDPVTIKETKCMFRGDPYHELLITW